MNIRPHREMERELSQLAALCQPDDCGKIPASLLQWCAAAWDKPRSGSRLGVPALAGRANVVWQPVGPAKAGTPNCS